MFTHTIQTTRLPRTIALTLLFSYSCATQAVRPLSEDDMSSVSAESTTLEALLNVSGETAAGDVIEAVTPASGDLNGAVSSADDGNRKNHDDASGLDLQIIPEGESAEVDPTLFQEPQTKSNHSDYGRSLSISDPRHKSITSEKLPQGLNITVNANIQRVQTENMAHGFDAGSRGSQYISNIQTSSSTLISER